MPTIIGTSNNDVITPSFVSGGVTGGVPSGSADVIVGGSGDDTINGGGGADTSFGGLGDDYIFAVLGTPESIDGGAGNDTLDTSLFGGNYVVNLATGLTNFAGESFVNMESLISGSGNDSLTGTGGANLIDGGDGNDTINGGGGADTSVGGNGNDYIFAVLGTPESIDGGTGSDTLDTTAFGGNYVVNLATGLTNFAGESFVHMEHLYSGDGNDSLTGTAGANLINGGDGNDTINGGGGADTSVGGIGNDYIFAVLGTPESIDGGTGNDTIDTSAFTGNYVVNLATGLTNFAGESFVNMENLISGSGNDSLTGTGGANLINGSDGNDTINGAGGADTSLGGLGNDYIFAVLGTPESIDGGAGNDTLDTAAFTGDYVVNLATGLTNFAGESFLNMENLISGAGDDSLTGTAGANSINGGDGNDTINGGGGADTSSGGLGNDYIFAVLGTPESIDGGAGVDTLDTTAFTGNYAVNLATGLTNFAGESFINMESLFSGIGNDSLTGTSGANLINGGDGNDTINGGGGADTSVGGLGNDYIFAVLGTPETVDGGTGNDTLDTTAFTGNYVVNLATGLTNFAGESFVNMENLISGAGNDSLTGTGGGNLINGGAGNDTINGGGGADTSLGGNGNDYIFAVLGTPETIDGGAGIDTLDTTAFGGDYLVNLATGVTNFAGESFKNMENLIAGVGNDTLTGSSAANAINGGSGSDSIDGGGGNDTINGGGGADTALGGAGNDYIYAVAGTPESIDGGLGIDTLDTTGFGGDYVVNLGTGLTNVAGESFLNMENLIAGIGNDTLTGSAAANTIDGGAGSNNIDGGGGNDRLNGGSGNDVVNGSGGNDTINGGGGADTSLGGAGNDYIYAVLGTPESIDGGIGTDTVDTTAFTGNYVVNLATGLTNFAGESFVNVESLISGIGNDTLIGSSVANKIDGGAGNDSIDGGGGNDTINGGGGADTAIGGAGNDYIYAVLGTPESIDGGVGTDTLDTTAFGGNYVVNLATGLTNFAGESFVNMENLNSGAGNDTLTGTGGANKINGGAGNDTIDGGLGADKLTGGLGADSLTGGGGTDNFVFAAIAESTVAIAGRDLIADFNPGDKIDVATIDANTGLAGNQAFTFLGAAAFSGVAGELRYAVSGGNTLVTGDVTGDAVEDFAVLVAGVHNFVVTDFLL